MCEGLPENPTFNEELFAVVTVAGWQCVLSHPDVLCFHRFLLDVSRRYRKAEASIRDHRMLNESQKSACPEV